MPREVAHRLELPPVAKHVLDLVRVRVRARAGARARAKARVRLRVPW